MKHQLVLLVAVFLAAFPTLAAPKKAKAAGRSHVRISRAAEKPPVTVLGEDPSFRRTGSGGYPAIVIGEPVRRFRGEPISLDLKDADIRDVLLTFSKLARLNMVIDPDVRGSVTVRLENVPWDQALEVILKVNGLGYVLEGSMVRVGSPAKL
jgi:type IV pilus assembly protein PilQ